MGGRGAFVDYLAGNWNFKEGKQTFSKKYDFFSKDFGAIKILKQNQKNVQVPFLSHSAPRVYAVIKEEKLKHIAFYDEHHNIRACIDLLQSHNGLKPHKHIDNNHKYALPLTEKEQALVDAIKKEFNLK